jgi:hypothetical protein
MLERFHIKENVFLNVIILIFVSKLWVDIVEAQIFKNSGLMLLFGKKTFFEV